jgi:diacylglycerol kinase family enzyme
MFIVKYYLIGALIALSIAIFLPHWYYSVIFAWTSLSLFIVSLAYLFDVPEVFRKRENGSIPFYIMWVLLPFFVGVQLYNSWARRNDSVPAIQEIAPNLFLACRLFPSDIEYLKQSGVGAILDATSEFSGLNWSAEDGKLAYINIPILDHSAPHQKDLMHALNWISNQIKHDRGVVVHCALGRGRSVLIVAAYLLASNRFDSLDAALDHINKIRGTAQLNKQQYKKLALMHKNNQLTKKESILLIVNPVSGGGSWDVHKDEIEQRLSVRYQIDCKLSTKELSAKTIAEQNKSKRYKMIVACGGDGTINEVGSVLIDTEILMGIIPLGTTNAFAHVVIGNRSKVKPIESACDDILLCNSIAVDTATCNDDILLLVAGVGFAQQMITSADRDNKNESGQLAYLEGLSAAITQNELKEYQISYNGQAAQQVQASSIVIANAAPFTTILAQGGRDPDPTDGMLDVTILDTQENLSLPLLSLLTKSITRKLHINDNNDVEGIHSMKVKTISIRGDGDIDYVVDGEVRKSEHIEISVNAKSLLITHSQQLNSSENTF